MSDNMSQDPSVIARLVEPDRASSWDRGSSLSLETLVAPMDRGRPLLAYRGPLQRNRLRVVIRALVEHYGDIDVIWLIPRETRERGVRWFDGQPGVTALRLLDARTSNLFHSLLTPDVRRFGPRDVLAAVNFTALLYARKIHPDWMVWFVQSAPEDRMHHHRFRGRLEARLRWRIQGSGRRPEQVVTVSTPLAEMVRQNLGYDNVVIVPNSVDDNAFRPPAQPTGHITLVYIGSGAPWQGIERLAELWEEIHRHRPSVRFRVVSGDARTRRLYENIAESNVEATEAWTPDEVADSLVGCSAGFIARTPSIASRASWPVKLGDYLAASVPVVAYDWDWDVADVVRSNACGYLLDLRSHPSQHAREILEWLNSPAYPESVEASIRFARSISDSAVVDQLRSLMPARN